MKVDTYLYEGWEFIQTDHDVPGLRVGFSEMGWLPATVPGHIHLDLQAHGIVDDPNYRMNELGQQWIDATDWSYRTQFDWEPDDSLPNRILRFDGLDTVCEIFLNGEKIASHDNMFTALEVDVADKLQLGTNTLRVNFKSAIKIGNERREAFFAKHGIAEHTVRFDERAFVRKVQCMYGWDWGPRLVSAGIWKPVRLIEFSRRILDVHTRQEWHEDGSVTLHVKTDVQGDADVTVSLEGQQSKAGTEVSFHVEQPELWEPLGRGEPHLYELVVDLLGEEDFEPVLDRKTLQIGFRTIQLRREPDEIGESFEFVINGRPLNVRGFNWIPDHSFPSALTRADYEDSIDRAVDLGTNMLRVWGGGLYESDDFFDLCARKGILVWQDFPFACAHYPDDEEWQTALAPEFTENIKRIRNFASLAMWCGNNENMTMWHHKWGGAENHPDRLYGDNFYRGQIPALLAELDPATPYTPSSPWGDTEVDCNAGLVGDSHYWDVWHGRGDWRFYSDSDTRFSSEFGFCASCSLSLWEDTLAEEDWDYRSPAVKWHDKTAKGYETFVGYVELHYPPSETLEDWTYYSQLNQRDALRYGIEWYRRNKFCSGTLVWQFNDIWPVQSWAVVDSSGRYRAAAYEMRRLHDNYLLSLERKNEKLGIYLSNDEVLPLDTMVWVTAHQLQTGEILRTWSFEVHAEVAERVLIGEIDLTGLSVPDTLITVESTVAPRTWRLLDEPKNARFGEPGQILLSNVTDLTDAQTVDIRVTSPVVDLMLSIDGDTDPFVDNFLTFPEPGIYSVRVRHKVHSFEARSLAGYHPCTITRSPL